MDAVQRGAELDHEKCSQVVGGMKTAHFYTLSSQLPSPHQTVYEGEEIYEQHLFSNNPLNWLRNMICG